MSARTDWLEVYKDNDGSWRWRFYAANGRTLADSAQGYSRRIDCLAGAERVTGCRYVRYRTARPDADGFLAMQYRDDVQVVIVS